MKEIARVEILDKTCDDCRFELAGCDRRYPNKIECNMLNDRKNWKVEQFPETFEELKELCKDIKGVEFAGGKDKGEIIELDNIWFAENGDIWVYADNEEEVCVIGKKRTPAQMWAIIKNLIGRR